MNQIIILNIAISILCAEDGISISKQEIVEDGVVVELSVTKKIEESEFFAISLNMTKVGIGNLDAIKDVEPQKMKTNNSQVIFTNTDKKIKFFVPMNAHGKDHISSIDLAWLLISKDDYIRSAIDGVQYPYTLTLISP